MPVAQTIQPMSARLLVADDQPHILDALEILFKGQGYQTDRASNPERVLNALHSEDFDAVLIDLNYTRDTCGGVEGLNLVSQIHSMDRTLPVVVMTAWSSVDLAVEAMRRGASDFVQKPWNNRELLGKVREQVERHSVLRRTRRQQEEESLEAREIQKSLLPGALPQVAGYDICASTQPMDFIGGDYYDVACISPTQTAFCIADVAGKGLPGALLMANLQATLKPLVREDISPKELCSRLNQTLCEIMPPNKFITFFYGVLDSGENRITYCNAGHNPPLLVDADGRSRELKSSGAVLGQFPRWHYEQADVGLRPGDTVLLFTDGLVEAWDRRDEAFGEQRLLRVVRESARDGAAKLQRALLNAVADHCNRKFQDDATMILLQRLPASSRHQ